MTVFIKTNDYNPDEPQYQRSVHILLNQATSDTRKIIAQAKHLLKSIYKTGYRYQKCSVQLGHIQQASAPSQIDLFDLTEYSRHNSSDDLMATIDKINHRFPKGITLSATGINTGWQSPVEHLSQRYTTSWDEIATVKC
jgi:DNA polymerase V